MNQTTIAKKEVRELVFMDSISWVETLFEEIQEPNYQDRIIACGFLANALAELEGEF